MSKKGIIFFKNSKVNSIFIDVICISLIISIITKSVAMTKYYETGNLYYFLANKVFNYLHSSLLFSLIVLVIITAISFLLKKYKGQNEENKISYALPSYVIIGTIIIIFIINGVRPVKNKSVFMESKTHNVSIFQYSSSILKDCMKNETEIATVSQDNIFPFGYMNYSSKSRRSSYNTHEIRYTIIKDGNIRYRYSAEYNKDFVVMVACLLKDNEKITVEYYKNSGIIKSVNGIDTTEHEEIVKEINRLKKELK